MFEKYSKELKWESDVSMLACFLVTRTCLKTTRGLISGTFRRLTLEVLSPKKKLLLSYLRTIQSFNDFTCWLVWNERMLAHWTQVSDRCPLGYFFFFFFLHAMSGGLSLTVAFLRRYLTFYSFKCELASFPGLITAFLPNIMPLLTRWHEMARKNLVFWRKS